MDEDKMREMLGQAQAMAGTPDKVEWRIGTKEAREIGVVLLHLFAELGESEIECERLGEGLKQANESACEILRERDSIRARYEREMASFKEGNARLASLLDGALKERDSLKEKLSKTACDRDHWRESADRADAANNRLHAERDSLAAELKAAVCARDHNRECVARLADEGRSFREKYERALGLRDKVIEDMRELKAERDELLSVRESLRACRDSACQELQSVKRERDGLKKKITRLKDHIAAFPDDVLGGGVA